jgi:hypothetical protein
MEKLINAIKVATDKVGFKELTGNNDGDLVDECLTLVGLDNKAQVKATGKGYAWCAAFVSWVYAKAGVTAIKNAWAPAWFPQNKVLPKEHFKPKPMDVFGLNFNNVINGHVGFVFYWPDDGDFFLSLEGNWGNKVDINLRKKSEVNAVARWI